MDVSLFDYDLPGHLIAQFPHRRRDRSRLLVLDRENGEIKHLNFKDITKFIKYGDGIVVNNTRVFKARLFGQRATGARVEIFLVRRQPKDKLRWIALASHSRRLKGGENLVFPGGRYLTMIKRLEEGGWVVGFNSERACQSIIAQHGHVPLPHYISREDQPADVRRYQTVFADKDKTGAVAAPTAGFHFTNSLISKLRKTGIEFIELTLHVGPGTFRPIKTDSIDDHIVDPEWAELSQEAAAAINRVKKSGGRLFVVGTTSVRTLESARIRKGEVQPFSGMVDLYIKPGHRFHLVDHLITNFHLPKSSLLVLVSAFAGREKILEAYREAVEQEYHFYSYGDAMLIL